MLKLCWVNVAAVWICSLQHWQTRGLMRSRFEVCLGLECDADTRHGSKGVKLSCLTFRLMRSFLHCQSQLRPGPLGRPFVCELSVGDFAYADMLSHMYTHISLHKIITDSNVTAPPLTKSKHHQYLFNPPPKHKVLIKLTLK